MTVAEVLDQLGWPLGRRGRTTCPFHQGGNEQAFTYTDDLYHCFVCGAGGNAWQLLEHFRPRKPLFGIRLPPGRLPEWLQRPRVPLSPSQRMARATEAVRQEARRGAHEAHYRAYQLLRQGQALLAQATAPDASWERGGSLVVEALEEVDRVDALLECDCREDETLLREKA